MTIVERANGFVGRADAALKDFDNAGEIWSASVRSNSNERRLHSFSLDLDNAIRKVDGPFETWSGLRPDQVPTVAKDGPIELFWLLSAHPSGRIREAFVQGTTHFASDRILPHLANRAIDFVAEIRQLANAELMVRLEEVLTQRAEPGANEDLPTFAHIAADKLLAPRTAIVRPELIFACISLAETATIHRPGTLSTGNLEKMLQRCRQTLATTSEQASVEAIEALVAYFNQNAILN